MHQCPSHLGGHFQKLTVMDLSTFRIAEEIQSEISELKQQLKELENGNFRGGVDVGFTGSTGFAIRINITGGKVCSEIGTAVRDVLRNRIEILEKKFMEL